MSLAEIAMVSCVVLTNVVERGVPLKFTAAPPTKFRPFTMSVKAGPPATTLDGFKDEIVGGGPYTLNERDVESPPPGAGLATKTPTVPVFSTSPA